MFSFAEGERAFVTSARVARLATADRDGAPHVVPICFAFDGRAFYSVIDAKPKRATGGALRRIRNLRENPRVALVIDRYAEDWRRLRYVLVRGRARILRSGATYRRGLRLLRAKYPQYRAMALPSSRGWMIQVIPERAAAWRGGPRPGKDGGRRA
jgi:PPOX class probable F420-dependent enzyme